MQVIRRYAGLLYVFGLLPTVRRETPLSALSTDMPVDVCLSVWAAGVRFSGCAPQLAGGQRINTGSMTDNRHAVQHSSYYVDGENSEYPVQCQGEALIHKQ